jgi:chitosanase
MLIEEIFEELKRPNTTKPTETYDPINQIYSEFRFNSLGVLQKKNILRLTSIFENSNMEFQWGYCENINDGRGYTCGISGFCSGTGDLVEVFAEYCWLRPDDKKAKDIYKILERTNNDDTSKLSELPKFFTDNKDNDQFKSAQVVITNKLYVQGCNRICTTFMIRTALGVGQIFDACTNHGESGAKEIALRVGNLPEQEWITNFLTERKKILAADKTWKEAIDRINVYQKLQKEENYDLKSPIKVKCYGDNFILV